MTRTRSPIFRASFDDEISVDNFAGGGGATNGIVEALGRPVDIAINHCAEAIAMHAENHPETKHYLSDIWEVDPKEAAAGRPVGAAWFSPDCKDFSRAKGTALKRSREVRSLAWVIVRWAKEVRPRVIFGENVEEFLGWGPLDENGKRIPERAGETFRAFIGALSDLGYVVDYRTLVAADYGTPTTRKRLFLIARCDGKPIVWPEATHGKGRPHAWEPASSIIDWSLPCPSIFDRKKPLAEATQRRIAVGLKRYVLESASPFLVKYHGERRSSDTFRGSGVDEPLRTLDTSNRFALVAPSMIQTSYGERKGQAPRVLDLHKPLGTVVAGGQKHALVAAWLAKHYGGPNGHFVVGHEMERPVGSITGRDSTALAAATIVKYYGKATAQHVDGPLHTVTSRSRFAEVRAFLTKFYGTSIGSDPQLPLPTITTGGHRGGGHLGLVVIHGETYAIADIGMRMLQPRELFCAQGFPREYRIDFDFNGKPLTKTAQIELAGNSVCRQVAAALVAANIRDRESEAA